MQIYVINLTRRADRLAKMDTALKALGLPYTRIEAIDGADADTGQPKDHGLPASAYACYLSHLKAYRAFLETGDSHCVIMEDDVALSPHLPKALSSSQFYEDKNAIIRLEAPANNHWQKPSFHMPRAVQTFNGLATYKLITQSYGTGAFVLPRGIAKRVLAQQTSPELDIDVRLFHQHRPRHLGFNILQFSPALAIQRQYSEKLDDSDIHPERLRREQPHNIHPMLRNLIGNLRVIFYSLTWLTACNRRFPFANK